MSTIHSSPANRERQATPTPAGLESREIMQIQFDKSVSMYDIARAAGYIGCRLVNSGTGNIIIMPQKSGEAKEGSCEKMSWSVDV